jgi:glutathione S-transferase
MNSVKPHLVSFKLCPFVQRSVIALKEKGVDFDITYIDLKNPPDWFKAISPFGKVPLLQVGDIVLFESVVIMEYLDEVYPPSLHPADPLRKAHNRAWFEFASSLFSSQYTMMIAKDQETYEKAEQELKEKLPLLEAQLIGPWFNGKEFSLADVAFAPFFMRQVLLEQWGRLRLLQNHPKVSGWSERLLARPSIQQSVVTDFAALFREYLSTNDSYGSAQLLMK